MNMLHRDDRRAGQSLVEAIVAVAVFSAISFVALTFAISSFDAAAAGERLTEVQGYATEAMEAVRAVRDRGWQDLTLGTHGFTTSSGYWDFAGTGDSFADGIARSVTVSAVGRDANGDIVASGGTDDPKTRLVRAYVTSTLSGAPTVVYSIAAYLTDWLLTEIVHTSDADWSGGAFTNVQLNGTGEPTTIGETWTVAGKQWIPGAGKSFTHTTVADFSAGTLSGTAVDSGGSGTPGRLALAIAGGSSWSVISTPSIGNHLNALSMFSSGDGFGVGQGGTIVRWNGSYWDIFASPTSQDLFGVAMTATDDGWAVGANGTILRWDGSAWGTFASPTGDDLNGISMISATDGFAAGGKGTILRWNGTSWSAVSTPTNQNLYAIQMYSATLGFAVGNKGTILRWDGSSWSAVASPISNRVLYGVYLSSPTFGFAVGQNGTVLEWNGAVWSSVSNVPLNDTLRGVFLLSSTFGYAVGGNGALMEWNGTSWTAVSAGTTHQLNGVYFVDQDNGWVLGNNGTRLWYGPAYEPSGTLLSSVYDSGSATSTWNYVYWTEESSVGGTVTVALRTGNTPTPDGTWSVWTAEYSNAGGSQVTVPNGRYLQYRLTLSTTVAYSTPAVDDLTVAYDNPTPNRLNSVASVSPTDVWAVGTGGILLRYDGSSWASYASPATDDLYSVSMASSTFGAAVGDSGRILRWDGTSWTQDSSGVTDNLHGASMISSTDGFAVGVGGRILRWGGGSWSVQSSGTKRALYGVSMLSSSFGFAVGDHGTIRRWDGSSWSSVSAGTNSAIYAVSMLSATDGFAVGQNGLILRWDGSAWSSVSSPTGANLRAVDYLDSGTAYAVGDAGTVLVWDGTSWTQDVTMTANALYGISLANMNEGWVAGDAGFLGHLTGSSGYMSSANYVSPILDSGYASTTWDGVAWNAVTSTATSVSVATRTGETPAPDANWSPFSVELTDPYGSPIVSPAGRYLQYRVTLSTTNPTQTAQLEDITISY